MIPLLDDRGRMVAPPEALDLLGGGGGTGDSDGVLDKKTSATGVEDTLEGIAGTGGASSDEGTGCDELVKDNARLFSRAVPDPMNCFRNVLALDRMED